MRGGERERERRREREREVVDQNYVKSADYVSVYVSR